MTEAANLALACPGCNLHKAAPPHSVDTETGTHCALYHPRRDVWTDHFCWAGTMLTGLTTSGRATNTALDLNHSRRQRVRQAEAVFGLFPPDIRN